MAFLSNIKEVGVCNAVSSVILPHDVELPQIGTKISEDGFDVSVIGVDEDSRKVDFHVKKTLDKKYISEGIRSKVIKSLDDVACLLYLWERTSGDHNMVSWDNIGKPDKKSYLFMASRVLKLLYNNNICFFDPDDFISDRFE